MTDERTRTLLGWLGKIVTVVLDKGSVKDVPVTTATPLKSGVVRSGNAGGDCRAYLLGTTKCGDSYTGKVVSVLRRYAEESDSLIVTPVGVEMYEPWIRAAISQREKLEGARLFCLYEKSCGVIPYRIREKQLEYLALFQSGSSTWSFPKGHMEYGEDELSTARREVFEEIGVNMEITPDFRCEIYYSVHNKRSQKKVVLFAVPFDGEITLREGEIGDAKWLPRAEIQKLFGHRELRGIFNRLERKLTEEGSTE